MAHIQEGVISGSLAAYGLVLSGALSVVTGTRFKMNNVPKVAMVTAAVFCASLLHFPLMGTSVHFTFVGLAGILLGPAAFLSVAVAVFFQMLLFQHGGVSTLGVNAFNIGMAALAGYYIFRLRYLFPKWRHSVTTFAFLAGFVAAIIMVFLLSATLLLTGFPFASVVVIFLSHTPVMLGEGLVAGFLAVALQKNKGASLLHD
ncbi:energy-coupling factor ABC transporter permease [Dethiobacter alkaliphilus]|uniref:Cobalamin (Vitamin B12) biosynthesis CbiM protein n=1 Tax=Dethiobacter alkaliphilus AHT 1 TaxID=555088 RepID=C0GC62_DETAL|nr:energy-coupling factor ABC transporter permease [Dethiobacter alkaliphilus]EEG78797.1 cobalamin (vitamin B12) biosynthesis CbiM protein [Dethiobacter alkaliphilus AHT 1]